MIENQLKLVRQIAFHRFSNKGRFQPAARIIDADFSTRLLEAGRSWPSEKG